MMRVFVQGRAVPSAFGSFSQLERGHEAIGTHRSPENAECVRALGAEPIALDLLDARAGFYGAPNDGLIEPIRKRQFPIIGKGGGVFSFIHLDDAAAATVLALDHDEAGIYNIVDDEPAPVREWLPVLATVLGAKPPRHVPRRSRG